MFRCERCGTGYNATVVAVSEVCPRCRSKGVQGRLSLRLFEPSASEPETAETGVAVAGPAVEDRGEEARRD